MLRQWTPIALIPLLAWTPVARAGADDLGLWRAFLSVGDGAPGAVVRRTDAARDSLVAFGCDLEVDPASARLMDRVREAVIELDLGGLHRMLPEWSGAERGVAFLGAPVGDDRYTWTLFPGSDAACDGRVLAVEGSTRLRPVDHDHGKGAGFAVHQEVEVGTGPWRHTDVAALFSGLLVELETAAGETAGAAARAAVARQQPGLDGPVEIALAAAVIDALPATAADLSRFVRVDRVGDLTDAGLNVDLLARLDLRGLRSMGYPGLARYLDRLDDVLTASVSIRDRDGLPLAELGLASATPAVRLAFTTHDGALLPTRGGAPDPARAVRPTDPSVDLRMRFDVEVRAEGMLLRVSDYEIPLHYRASGSGADIDVPIRSEPRLEFTGQGTVTTWIAELADSALNLETQGQAIFKAVAAGVDGDGSRARMRFVDGSTRGVVSARMDTLLVDNAMIQMGFRIVGRSLTPDDEVVAEALALAGALIRDLDHDYASVRDALAAWDG